MLPVESLRDAEAITFDTTEMVLFDGSRCHSVTPFEGERYSLVYFTTPGYAKASAADREMLVASAWPTDASQLHFAVLLAPPKGNRQRGIRSACGLAERPAALQRSERFVMLDQHHDAGVDAQLTRLVYAALLERAREAAELTEEKSRGTRNFVCDKSVANDGGGLPEGVEGKLQDG